jgi:hypothetical protein
LNLLFSRVDSFVAFHAGAELPEVLEQLPQGVVALGEEVSVANDRDVAPGSCHSHIQPAFVLQEADTAFGSGANHGNNDRLLLSSYNESAR